MRIDPIDPTPFAEPQCRRDFIRALGLGAAAWTMAPAWAQEATAAKPPGALRLEGADFTAQLPWFYHGLPFDRWQAHDIYSFEANALDLPPGDYAVALLPTGNAAALAVSFDGIRFKEIPVRAGHADLTPFGIRNRMISFYVKGAARGGPPPVRSVLIYPVSTPFATARDSAVRFKKYRRDTLVAQREILQEERWGEFHTLLQKPGFGQPQLRAMFDDVLAWAKRRQVVDPANVHYGAIYSEEDKYDFRDAAAAAVCFSHAWRDTRDPAWRQRALDARAYAFKGQHIKDPANRHRYGAFSHMVEGGFTGAPRYRRLTDQLPRAVGVETCIAVNHLTRTIELGLEPSDEDLRRLELAAGWVAANEFLPGSFRHTEGYTRDIQNPTALGMMALARAYDALAKLGRRPPQSWLDAARRAMRHYLEGQEAIGCWPYEFATIGRGQAYSEHNIPDQGMGVYHFMVACGTSVFRDWPGLQEKMQRAARWWLCMSYIDRRGPRPTINLDDRLATGSLKFSAFTWNRFTAAASLLRIAEHTGQPEPWRSLALRYMEHVHTKLWNRTDPNTAPVVRATREDMKLQTWIQAAEWDAVMLRDMEERLP